MNNTVIITRFHYPKNHPDFQWRFEYYKKEVLPRLMRQSDQGFDIAIWCEKHHEEIFRGLSPKIRIFQAKYLKRDSRLFIDYTDWTSVKDLPKYKIQIGLDSDDLVSSEFIKMVHLLCQGDDSILASFQPIKKDIETGKKYKMDQYNKKRGSPIFAFYQPDFNNYKFAYHTSHLRMPLIAEKVIIVPEGYAEMSIHQKNDSTKIKLTDKLCI